MLNSDSLFHVDAALFSHQFRRPLYDSYCFAHIPQTIQWMLTGQGSCPLPREIFGILPQRYKKVILLFIDAFGWTLFERYAQKIPFLRTIYTHGVASKLTAMFPSTTLGHLTCINTGLDIAQSGLYEWFLYEPQLDEMICPFTFSSARDKDIETLSAHSKLPSTLYPQQTLYQSLHAAGIPSYVIQNEYYCRLTFSKHIFQGATVLPYATHEQALAQLKTLLLTNSEGPGYYFFYTGLIDHICHYHGPDSPHVEEALNNLFAMLADTLLTQIAGNISETACLVVADHGQVKVDPETTLYLNQELPELEQYLCTNRQGRPLVPAGSARALFLHVQEQHVASVVEVLQKQFTGKAEVYRTGTLLSKGIFGNTSPSLSFLRRVGNVCILPYSNESVWWYEKDVFSMPFVGHHGGLTPPEMEIPLLLLSLSERL